MTRVISAVKSVCDENSPQQIPLDLALQNLKGWDSMRAVNLQVELEALFSVDLSEDLITGQMTIADIVAILKRKGVTLAE